MTPIVFAFPGTESLSRGLCAGLEAGIGVVRWRHFPDGESLIALDGDCEARDVVVIATLRDPDRLALPLMFAARTARELCARSVGLVAPYLAYMRQDARFHAGEAISAVHFATFLSSLFDWLVTVDPHLHRTAALGELFEVPAECVSAMPLVGDWIRAHVDAPVLIGPDGESAQWVRPLAERIGAPVSVLEKERRGDRAVRVSPPLRAAIEGRTPVLVDDIVSSGRTLIETIARLRELGAAAPVCIAVHGVFADQADIKLSDAGAAGVVSTNTIEHATNAIDVTSALLPAVRRRLGEARASPAR